MDVYAEFDYRHLAARAGDDEPGIHLVLVPNPPFRPQGDYTLDMNSQPARVGLSAM